MELTVKTSTGSYKIYLERGALNRVGEILNLDRKVLIVTDSGVPKIYAEAVERVSKNPYIVTVPEGETSKSIDNFKMLLQTLTKYDFTRSDCVVAVGGGVVGDLAGFTAACYMRGIDFYNIPTTLLSQVDSSIGGKTAIDFGGYKNIVGAFYPPKCVVVDSDTLKTLPDRQISNGLAESVKMSLTSDRELFEIFENGDIHANIDLIIEKSLRIKKRVVEEDEKEAGIRKILNFGHTIAHAIESENALENLYHGECVAIGMLPMCSPPVRTRLSAVLKKLNLPTSADCDLSALLEAIRHDKKMSGDNITVVCVDTVGEFSLETIPYEEMIKTVAKAFKPEPA